jgi:hypothetical protein
VEPLTRGLPPPDPRSLCPLSATKFVEPRPPKKFLGTPMLYLDQTVLHDSLLTALMQAQTIISEFPTLSGFYTCKECHKTGFLQNHTATAHRERERLGDRRNVGESSCNCGDGTGQMAQPLIMMMMLRTSEALDLHDTYSSTLQTTREEQRSTVLYCACV